MSPSGTTLPFGPNRANDRSGSTPDVSQFGQLGLPLVS